MLFNSLHYLLFLPIAVALYYLISAKYRWMLVFVASCYFYMSFIPKYILVLFVIILIDYSAARLIENASSFNKKLLLFLSVSANLALLGFFKYYNFVSENVTSICQTMGINFHPGHLDWILPIGLSFHTLQSMGYTIEVYRGNQKAERHLGYFANYVLFFPQMVAGPIERFATLGNELRKDIKPIYENFSEGFRLILFGLLIKMAIADNIAPYVTKVYDYPSTLSGLNILLGVVVFAFQIYADFYGYSSIALGSARLLGIKIIDNFNTPFSSKSVTEFWRRWHISLSTWFNDYVFTSFVTTARNWGKAAIVLGLLLTFFLSGLWHGAGWNFIVYGLMHGVALVFEFFTKKWRKKLAGYFVPWLFNSLAISLTFLYVASSWVFFRAFNIKHALLIFQSIANNWHMNYIVDTTLTPLFASLAIIGLDVYLRNSRFDIKLKTKSLVYRWAVYSIFIFCLLALAGTERFTFIYFQF